MTENFEMTNTTAVVAEDKNSKITASKQEFINEIRSNPELAAKRRTMSDMIEVETIIRCKGLLGRTPKASAGRVVGYTIKNVGDAPVEIKTTKYKGEGPGTYEGTPTVVTLKPGSTMKLSKASMAINFTAPEYGGYLANGRITADIDKGTPEEVLESTTFAFRKDAANSQNATEFADKDDKNGGYVLKVDYIETFGFLANKAVVNKVKDDVTDKEAQAHYVYTLAKEQGLIPAEM